MADLPGWAVHSWQQGAAHKVVVRRPDLCVGAEKSDTEADDGGGSGGSKSSENSSLDEESGA
eukprot:scaffold12907_cov107-Isochrysis_galbana.AAC.1